MHYITAFNNCSWKYEVQEETTGYFVCECRSESVAAQIVKALNRPSMYDELTELAREYKKIVPYVNVYKP